jgi:hypothetical protein
MQTSNIVNGHKINESQIYDTSLTEKGSGLYKIDFNTENFHLGENFLVVSLKKENCIGRTAIIRLNIINREIEIISSYENGNLKIINSNENLYIQIMTMDAQNQSKLISGALITFKFNGETYNFVDHNNGSYSLLISSKLIPTAFFEDNEYNCKISVQKPYYLSHIEEIKIKVIIFEIFPGRIYINWKQKFPKGNIKEIQKEEVYAKLNRFII